MTAQEQHAESPSVTGGRKVALVGGHDRALHENVPLSSKCVGVRDTGLGRERLDEFPDVGQVLNTRLPNWALRILDLDHCRQECTAVEIRISEPFAKHLEYGQQPGLRSISPVLRLGLQPFPRPQLLTPPQEVQYQLVLRAEIAIQRHFRRAGVSDNGVDSDTLR